MTSLWSRLKRPKSANVRSCLYVGLEGPETICFQLRKRGRLYKYYLFLGFWGVGWFVCLTSSSPSPATPLYHPSPWSSRGEPRKGQPQTDEMVPGLLPYGLSNKRKTGQGHALDEDKVVSGSASWLETRTGRVAERSGPQGQPTVGVGEPAPAHP